MDKKDKEHKPGVRRIIGGYTCPYHGHVVQGRPGAGEDMTPMARYLTEGGSDRYAILPQTRFAGATPRDCKCVDIPRNMSDGGPTAQK